MDLKKVADILQAKGVKLPCHRCGTRNFSVIDGYVNYSVQPELSGGIVIGGPTVPAVLVACDNCGALTAHALGALGLLPSKGGEHVT
ncbi:hypothetical protein ACM9XB_18750 [Xanthomonas sacchari]